MHAGETRFQNIIEGTLQYVVPLFQRAYSWERKEWDVLWDDLLYLSTEEDPRSHFIGSIVTIPTTSVPEGVSKFLLIDGQQRLTTIFILLSILRDRAREHNDELANEIHQTKLVNYFKKGNEYYKLLPTQLDRDEFKRIVNEDFSRTDSQIAKCYEHYQKKIRRTNVDLHNLFSVILERLSVVSIVLDKDDNPHLVFESLNAKGRPLSQADLIRNYFFMRIHIDNQYAMYVKNWKPMEDSLGDSLTEFIRHYLMKTGKLINKNDVYFTLKEKVSDGNALESLEELARFAKYYTRLINPSTEPNRELRVGISRLNRLEVTTVYPFLLNCYDDYFGGKLSDRELCEIIGTIENFVIRRFVCNVPTNQLNKIFPVLYSQASSHPISLLQGVIDYLQTRNYPKDSEFQVRLQETRLYGSGQRAIKTKLILESIEESYGHKERASFENLTIEHVMPQTLSEDWKRELGESWQIDHEMLLHVLGNLTLTAYNSELSNTVFREKRKSLIESHIELNKEFNGYERWTSTEIKKRSREISEKVLHIWPYFGDDSSGDTSIDDVTGKAPKVVIIFNQSFLVQSWRDVLEKTLETISELEPDLFERLAQEYPRFISKDHSNFTSYRKLDNGYFFEVNFSAKTIYSFCNQMIDSLELDSDDWQVEMR